MIKFGDIVYKSLGIGLVFAAFATYPIALVPPGLTGLSYHVRIPWILIVTLVSLLAILLVRMRIRPLFAVGTTIYSTVILIQIARHPDRMPEAISQLGLVVVPLASSVYFQRSSNSVHRLAAAGFGLWLLLAVYGLMNLFQHREVIGITGNRNWMAISILASVPWAWLYLNRCAEFSACGRRRWFAGIIVLVPTVVLMHACASRAAWLALAAFVIVTIYHRLTTVAGRALLVIAIIVCSAGILANAHRLFIRWYLEDIRIPTWVSTVKLIRDRPWLGVGPGNYLRDHAPYRAGSEYHRRKVGTDTTDHPHNEFLHLAASLGLPAAVCWLVLQFPVLMTNRGRPPVEQCARFSVFVIIVHSLLDEVLVQPPSDIMAMALTGILWTPWVSCKTGHGMVMRHVMGRSCLYALSVVLALIGFRESIRDVRVGWQQRLAATCRSRGDYRAAFAHYAESARLDATNPKGWYGAGAIAVQNLLDPARALNYLHPLEKIDPNYAHLNRLLGKAYGTLNDQPRALTYFERECRLFGADTAAFQNYFTCLFRNQRFDDLPRVYEYLQRLYVERCMAYWPTDRLRELAAQWLAAAEQGDADLAITTAVELCRPLDIQFVDPALTAVSGGRLLSAAFIFSSFNAVDARYWSSLLRRNQVRREVKSRLGLSGDDPLSASFLTNPELLQMSIDPDAAFQLPEETCSASSCSALSYAALISWLSEFDHSGVYLIDPESTPGKASPFLVSDGGEWRWFAIHEGVLPSRRPMIAEEGRGPASSVPETVRKSGSLRLFVHPQEFLLKNQILFTVMRGIDPAFPITPAPLPTFRMLDAARSLREVGSAGPWMDLFFSPAVSAFASSLQQRSAPE